MNDALEAVLGIILILGILLAAVALGGAFIWGIWNWGVTFLWPAAPHLSFWKATIASMLLALVRHFYAPTVKIESKR